jgi:LPS export ABC transporter protein LptC
VITSSDGLRLDTTIVHWDANEQRLWTDQPVTISREGSIIQGTGLNMTAEDETTTIAGRVRATFVRGPRR